VYTLCILKGMWKWQPSWLSSWEPCIISIPFYTTHIHSSVALSENATSNWLPADRSSAQAGGHGLNGECLGGCGVLHRTNEELYQNVYGCMDVSICCIIGYLLWNNSKQVASLCWQRRSLLKWYQLACSLDNHSLDKTQSWQLTKLAP
jgi:hypothetical protein